MAQLSGACPARSNAHGDDGRDLVLEAKHKIFLSHSGAQKAFVEQLCLELERCYRFPFFDKRHDSLPIGENFPQLIFDAIRQCQVGVVILSNEFFTSKWPMMELAAMMEEVEKRKPYFKVMPVFLRISLEEFKDLVTHTQWLSCWRELALQDPSRVIIDKWKAALKYLALINSLVYNHSGELSFQRMIVDAICEVVPSEIRLEDSHIQGRLRLCKVIRDKIDVQQKDNVHGVCIVGLYGMGGIGKTSICKVLCNEFFTEFRGRVCHAELERGSEEELLRAVMKKLSDTSSQLLDKFNADELRNGLKEGIIKEAIFLTLDNMADTIASINQVKSYLSARLPLGSIVIVTSRSKESLLRIRRYIDENNCMEMPELEKEEAKSLFVKSSDFESSNEADEQLIERCIERCHFLRDSGSRSYHYHPLALDVLGCQLGFIDPMEWGRQLDKIDEDIFNSSRENNHPIFSILRKSFDTLSREDQLLFMDVALFLPTQDSWDVWVWSRPCRVGWSMLKWLGMVHRIPSEDDVMRGLGRLKAKSLLESLGDGIRETSIGMHDLWRALCVAETKYGELRWRRWIYEAEKCTNELVETNPSGTCWENVMRMAFLSHLEMISNLERVNFAHFSNVTVLKIVGLKMRQKLVLDLSGLIHLKSLEVSGRNLHLLDLQSLPRALVFLSSIGKPLYYGRIIKGSSRQLVKQIGGLKELQCLQLVNYRGGKLPDMRSMVSMRVAIFYRCEHVVTLTGLSSKLTYLRVLDISNCRQLQSCPGVGDLVSLEELNCRDCGKLERLPDLRKLTNLRILEISNCCLINEVLGLDNLVALEELYTSRCDISQLPEMHKLSNLRVLNMLLCPLEVVPAGFERLTLLHDLKANFHEVLDKPNLRLLTKLQVLVITGSLAGLRGLNNLALLESLSIGHCHGVNELPEFRSLVHLRSLAIENCGFKDLSGLINLSALEDLEIMTCYYLKRLPQFQRLTRLKSLHIGSSDMLRGWECTLGHAEVNLSSFDRFDLPDSQQLMGSQGLLHSNNRLLDLVSTGALSQLQSLDCEDLRLWELPDLSNFPRLETVYLNSCDSVRRLSSRGPMNALSTLELLQCSNLTTLPDLCNFPRLVKLEVFDCDRLTGLSSSGPLTALTNLLIRSISRCITFQTLPDLGMFPSLKRIELMGLTGLTTLSSSVPLPALKFLTVIECNRSLNWDVLDQLRASYCPQCEVYYHDLWDYCGYDWKDVDREDSSFDDNVDYDDDDEKDDYNDEKDYDDEEDSQKTKRSRVSSVELVSNSD